MNPVNIKKCNMCLIDKPLSDFNKCKKHKDELTYWCKSCVSQYKKENKIRFSEYQKQYVAKNKDRIKKRKKEYSVKNRKKLAKSAEKWRQKNKEKVRNYHRRYLEKNREIINKKRRGKPGYCKYKERIKSYIKNRYKNDIKFNLDYRMSANIKHSLKKNKKGYKWEDLVGYDGDELKNHLTKYFTEGMTWGKYLNGEIEIDHIICKELFEYKDFNSAQFKFCWSLSNLRPSWYKENAAKSDILPNGRRARTLTKEEKLEYLKFLGYNF